MKILLHAGSNDLLQGLQSVQIHMKHGKSSAGVVIYQGERWRVDPLGNSQSPGDTFGQLSLARSEVALHEKHVTGCKAMRELAAF